MATVTAARVERLPNNKEPRFACQPSLLDGQAALDLYALKIRKNIEALKTHLTKCEKMLDQREALIRESQRRDL